jgi:TolA-binding protein
MGDAMKRSLCVLGATALMSCVPCSSFAEGPTTASPPSVSAISYKMSDVTSDLAKKQTGEPVQNQQKRIVRDLDELIASLEKQFENSRGKGASNKPRRPATMVHGGTGGIGDLVDPSESAKDWAKLEPRERDRILQSMSEGFPPEYRTVLERYYRRLAQEKTATSTGDSAKPKTAEPGSDKP